MVTAVVKIHFTIYVLTNFIENAIKSDRGFNQHRIRTRTKTGLGVQIPVHDYKHSKGKLLVTMLPELHLHLIFYVPHYKTIQFDLSTTDIEIKCYLKKLQLVNLCSLVATVLFSLVSFSVLFRVSRDIMSYA